MPTSSEWVYRMPAEWEPHEGTLLAWPHNASDWPGKFAAIPWVYAEVVRHLHRSEKVIILVTKAQGEQKARQVLKKVGLNWENILFVRIPTNRVWTRDYGPIFVVGDDAPSPPAPLSEAGREEKNKLAGTDWRFNAWAKYSDWKHDNAVPGKLGKILGFPLIQPRVRNQQVVLEGGSIDVNGQGLLMTTEECLLSEVQQRNPGLTKEDLEKAFADYLGIRKVLWLGRGIAGDDTHGHVDDLARFVGPQRVVTVVEDNPDDPNYEPLRENLDRLRGMTDLDGKALEVVTLPMPAPVVFDGQRLPASYANFYIANDLVLVPNFNDPKDRQALGILSELFPDRQVVGIHAVDLVWGLGTLHCMTQQVPRSAPKTPRRG